MAKARKAPHHPVEITLAGCVVTAGGGAWRSYVILPHMVTHFAEVRMQAESGGMTLPIPHSLHVFGDDHQHRWQGDDVAKTLSALFPDGVPSRAELSNPDLVHKVRSYMLEHMKDKYHPDAKPRKPLASEDTIFRAAGRRPRKTRK
jgi:hypothetical protein